MTARHVRRIFPIWGPRCNQYIRTKCFLSEVSRAGLLGRRGANFEHPRPEGVARFDGPSADVANRHPIPLWITDRLADRELPAW
jgi:hypothetical protein